ncbi:MAG: helix-turn-helix transcriptional regulator [Clostridia bacterium]|nr:helix-turn-helix transcriptional regulator [Clostridia bacterium]
MDDKKMFSKRLVELRNKKKKTRAEVAAAVGISISAVAMYERGERIPKDDVKRKLADFYGKSVAYIFFA